MAIVCKICSYHTTSKFFLLNSYVGSTNYRETQINYVCIIRALFLSLSFSKTVEHVGIVRDQLSSKISWPDKHDVKSNFRIEV